MVVGATEGRVSCQSMRKHSNTRSKAYDPIPPVLYIVETWTRRRFHALLFILIVNRQWSNVAEINKANSVTMDGDGYRVGVRRPRRNTTNVNNQSPEQMAHYTWRNSHRPFIVKFVLVT